MNTSTLIFKSKSAPRVSIFGLLLLMLSFFTISSANAQNISELNQFLGSQEAEQLGIDNGYLFGSQPTIHITRTRIILPEEGIPSKAEISMSAMNRLSEAGDALQNAEILQVKISSEDQKSGSIPASVLDQMPSLKVIFILSEAPISSSEVQSMVSSIQNPAVKILYLYSQPV
ncbi:hypothetical protein KUV23_13485 [Algoriphagus marincola]|uniref:Uncharacterized protein n=1 Tax=Algoriphagus marincola TaxID=264027 RepID=A0ABS7N6Q0_9BACT|nr:hypothetical protein [Algoriphagus marincola]MBY5951997.1 hypothetical protein [Algoriphagus marincola]